ncbi:MAG TPA: phytanoyl-CoA dioxygenase family protein [Acidimicrobiales bacterium]|nr:phytanoyl-CoA dioxygenase family protein [Acidimicrobiales bacterium]
MATGVLKDRLERGSFVVVEDVFDPEIDFRPLYEEWESALDEIVEHCTGDTSALQGPGQIGIPASLLPAGAARAVPMRAGSALFFDRRLIHGSYDNHSADRVRISLDLRYQPTGQPSGRPMFPSFVARSQRRPAAVLSDPLQWQQLWFDARERLAEDGTGHFNRWRSDSLACA